MPTRRGIPKYLAGFLLVSACTVLAGEESKAAATSATPVSAPVVYYMASQGGEDRGPGNADKPFASFEVALAKLKAGDTLILRKGLYPLTGVLKPKCRLLGTAERPITIRGEDGAVIKGLYDKATNKDTFGCDRYSGVFVGKSEWVVIENLEMVHNGYLGAGESHITYRNCHIHDYSNYGLITNGYRHLTVENCRIHGSTVEHGIYLTTDNQEVVIRNCVFSDTAINGIHINGSRNRRILIEGCTFHHVSRDWGACITLMGAREIVIRHNVFFCNSGHILTATNKGKEGQAVVYPSGIHIHHNTVYQPPNGRPGAFLVAHGDLKNWDVHHNAIFVNKSVFDVAGQGPFENVAFRENLFSVAVSDAHQKLFGIKDCAFSAAVDFVKPPALGDQAADLHLRDKAADGKYGAYASGPSEVQYLKGAE